MSADILKIEILPAKRQKPPTQLTDQLINDLCALLLQGAHLKTAVQACGISMRQFNLWMREDNEGEIYERLRESVYRARGITKAAAESAVFNKNPALWLEQERKGDRAWTEKRTSSSETEEESAEEGEAPDLSALTNEEVEQLERLTAKLLGKGSQ